MRVGGPKWKFRFILNETGKSKTETQGENSGVGGYLMKSIKCVLGLHDADWQYVAPDSCNQVRICKRCRAQRGQRTFHEYDDGEYVAPDSCKQVYRCKRCAALGEVGEFHNYSEWNNQSSDILDSSPSRRSCLRCRTEEICSHHPNVSRMGGNTPVNLNTCRTCGKSWED